MAKKDRRKKYDWKKLTKEWLDGPYETVQEYIRWTEKQKEIYPDVPRPSRDSILITSKKLNWLGLKEKKNQKAIDKLVNGAIDKKMEARLDEIVQSRLAINRSQLKLLVHYANNPEEIQMRGNLSDLINDLKRGYGMVTKEQQSAVAPNIQVNNALVGENSLRKQLEEMTPEQIEKSLNADMKRLEAFRRDDPEPDEIVDAILEEDDDDDE